MPRYRITKRSTQPGMSTTFQERVVEVAEGQPLPMSAVTVPNDTPLSDWADASAAPTPPAPEETE